MFCPKCSNELDLFAEKCLSCGTSFKSYTLAQRKALRKKPSRPAKDYLKKPVKSPFREPERLSPKATPVRIEYNNGIACKEGMSYTGSKLKKGSFKKRPNNEGIGFRLPAYGLGERHY